MIEIKRNRRLGRGKVIALQVEWAEKGEIYTRYTVGTATEIYNYYFPKYYCRCSTSSDVETSIRIMLMQQGVIVANIKLVTPVDAIKAWCEDITGRVTLD